MKVFIFGGSGFIGSALTHHLLENDYVVVNYSRQLSTGSAGNITQIKGDISNIDLIRESLIKHKPEIVIQNAWITDHKNYRSSEMNLIFETSTKSIFDLSKELGIPQFIGIGSSAEYGTSKNDEGNILDLYGISKLRTSEYLLNENKESGIETSWLRIFQPYGITQDRSRLIPMLIYKLMNQHKVTIDNPNSERDWISVDDIAKAVIWIIEKRIIGSIDVGTSVGTKTKEIVKLLAALMNVSYENVRLNLNNSQPDSLVASPESKLFKANWRPRANFETEIEKIIHSKKQLF